MTRDGAQLCAKIEGNLWGVYDFKPRLGLLCLLHSVQDLISRPIRLEAAIACVPVTGPGPVGAFVYLLVGLLGIRIQLPVRNVRLQPCLDKCVRFAANRRIYYSFDWFRIGIHRGALFLTFTFSFWGPLQCILDDDDDDDMKNFLCCVALTTFHQPLSRSSARTDSAVRQC